MLKLYYFNKTSNLFYYLNKMIPISPILYGIWCVLVIVLTILIGLFAYYRGRDVSAGTTPSNWCYSDWLCGEGDKFTSPVLNTIPTMYACRSTNFISADVDVGGTKKKITCACPILYKQDYDTGKVLGKESGTEDYYDLHPAGNKSKDYLYICDNLYSGNAIYDDVSKLKKVQTSVGEGGPCPTGACEILWESSYFKKKEDGTMGSLKTVPAGIKWGMSGADVGVQTGERTAPGPWTTIPSGTKMPYFAASMLLDQTQEETNKSKDKTHKDDSDL